MPNYELAAERAARKHGIDPRIFKAMIRAESNFNPRAGSPAGARGIAQFMPATARAYGVDLDDGRVADDLDGAARYLKANLRRTGGNYHQALSIYNSGQPDKYRAGGYPETIAYVNKIMGGRKNETLAEGGGRSTPSEDGQRTRTRTVTTSPGVDNSQARAQILTRFLQSKSANPVDMALQFRQLQDVAPTTKKVTETVGGHDGHDHSPAQGGPRRGNYTVAAGANRAGVPMTRDIRRFLANMTRSGRSVTVGTGSNHSRMTASGNVSDHWDGNAADIPATGKQGDLIAAHAIRAATGMPYQQALAKARQGGIQNFQTPKGRVQIIWRAPGHFDHVHVGVRR